MSRDIPTLFSGSTFQLLTKRSRRMRDYITLTRARLAYGPPVIIGRQDDIRRAVGEIYPVDDMRQLRAMSSVSGTWASNPQTLPHVWLGVSVEDQEYADKRIPDLLATPAAVRFVSYEPALGMVDWRKYLKPPYPDYGSMGGGSASEWRAQEAWERHWRNRSGLDQIIIGGESGCVARPFNIDWARQTIRQCRDAGVACFVKQLGAVPVMSEAAWRADGCRRLLSAKNHKRAPDGTVPLSLSNRKGGDMSEWPEELRVRQFPSLGGPA